MVSHTNTNPCSSQTYFHFQSSFLIHADSVICLWRLSDGSPVSGNLVSSETAANKETWSVVKTLRGHLEDIYDLCWSPDSNFIVSGSVDNTAVVWDVQKGEVELLAIVHVNWLCMSIEKRGAVMLF